MEHPNEYVGVLLDNYYDLWTMPPTKYEGRDIEPGDIPEGHSHFGRYFAGSRAAMLEQDPLGYTLIEKFVSPYLTYTPELPRDFTGTFSMRFDPAERYTYKTSHLTRASLTGNGDANLIGNQYDNTLTGNSGNNTFTGGGGNDELDGGDGEDTALFDGPSADYEIAYIREAVMVRDRLQNRDGTDLLRGIEMLGFSDESIPLQQQDAGNP